MEDWLKWTLGIGAAAAATVGGAAYLGKKTAQAILPSPAPQPGPAPYVPPIFTPPAAPPTTIQQTIDPVTNLPTITLKPGAMGNVSLLSAASFGNPNGAPQLYLAAPPGGAAIMSVVSSDPSNVASNSGSGQMADATPALALGGAQHPGQVTMTVSWFDAKKAMQTSTFTITAT
jgi:hypothetical protein